MKLRSTLVLLLALSLAASAVLAGCGGGGGSTGGGKTSKPTEPPKPAYPDKPIEMVAPSGAGGGWDTFARGIAKVAADEKLVSQPIQVINKAGGSGAVALAWMMSSKKGDAYELIVYSPPLIINGLNGTSKYTYKDLTPLVKMITDYNVILVKADSPYKTLKDLLEAAKQDPAKVSIGGGSAPGSMDHLAYAKIAKAAGIGVKDIKYVSFQGGGEALASLLGGHVTAVSSGIGESLGQIEAKTVRALAVTADQRLGGVLAGAPTVREAGYDVTYQIWRGVFGPAEMPEAAKKYWQDTLTKMTKTEGWKNILKTYQWNDALEVEGFGQFLDNEAKIYEQLLGDLGMVKK